MKRLSALLVMLAVLGLSRPSYGQMDGGYILVYKVRCTVCAVDTAANVQVKIPVKGFLVMELEPGGQAVDAGIVFYGRDHGGGKVFMTASINDADLELDHNFEGSFATIEMNIYKDGDFPHFVSMTGRLKTMNVGIENKNDASRHFRGNMSLRGGKFLDDVQSPVGSGHISAILSLSRTRRANAAFENVTSVLDGITAELLDRGYHNLENDVPVPEPPR